MVKVVVWVVSSKVVHCAVAYGVGYDFAQRRDLNMRMLFKHSRVDREELPYIDMASSAAYCSILG
jgi:hypothetical protein